MNDKGQLGLGDLVSRGAAAADMGDDLPEVDLGKDFFAVAVSAGYDHTCALSAVGRVKCWGDNTWGQVCVCCMGMLRTVCGLRSLLVSFTYGDMDDAFFSVLTGSWVGIIAEFCLLILGVNSDNWIFREVDSVSCS